MIHHPFTQKILEWAEIATEGHWLFHSPFKWFYRELLTPIFGWYLRRGISHQLRLVCRHSVLKGGDFNVFRSDVDYALVFAKEPLPSDLAEVLDRYHRLRSIFPIIGELECYVQSEWRRKMELADKHGEILSFIHFFRKAAWQFSRLALADKFQRRKAGRALMRMVGASGFPYDRNFILEAAQLKTSAFLAKFDIPPVEGDIEACSHFLGWSFGTHPQGKDFLHLPLSATECVLFAALLPGGHHDLPQRARSILEARAQISVSEAYRSACAEEYLHCCSVQRMNDRSDHVLEKWLIDLRMDADLTFSGHAP